jgi:predicted nucleic acid-binding OB-fold protein
LDVFVRKKKLVAQAIEESHFRLFELELRPTEDVNSLVKEGIYEKRVYIGPDERDIVKYVIGRTSSRKLTDYSKRRLPKNLPVRANVRIILFRLGLLHK